jgi:hypothetical protein
MTDRSIISPTSILPSPILFGTTVSDIDEFALTLTLFALCGKFLAQCETNRA